MNSDRFERIRDGRTDLVFEHLDDGHAATAADAHGTRLIQWCAYYGDVSAIRLLLANGETLASLGDNLGLGDAVFHGHWPLCQFLIEQGANPNHVLPDTGESPLHLALCKANRPAYDAIVEMLLVAGANPDCATLPGVETGSFMRDVRTQGETPLHRAAAFGSERVIDLLLAAGARTDARDRNGDSPLAWASWHLRPDAILRKLCFGDHFIHPARNSTYDHGTGWGVMGVGKPHLERR
ncbi:ankyrin repeat domain-containing protein [Pseudoxanthomonas sp. z9]|uniref:ankyrin repeat domain-containing protein n=1 Tax=Pseudoxanthomonas sp. z9 TaxID=2584942 RepID=UPI00114472F4|nr:ankyrin repeat domain-containing protein [Pseudoxanthomonas sp. z9]